MSFGKREGSLYKTHSAGIKLDGSGFVSLYLSYHAVRGARWTRALTGVRHAGAPTLCVDQVLRYLILTRTSRAALYLSSKLYLLFDTTTQLELLTSSTSHMVVLVCLMAIHSRDEATC